MAAIGRPASSACSACRAKKKSCDLKRPVCSRCIAKASPCIYPKKAWRFLTNTFDNRLLSRDDGISTAQTLSQDLSASLERSAALTSIDDLFWTLFAPEHVDSSKSVLARSVALPYLLAYRDLALADAMVQDAVHALALVCAAHHMHKQDLFQSAIQYYARALSQVNSALQEKRTAVGVGVLAACRVLGLYEVFRPSLGRSSTQGADWITHAYGMCSIARLYSEEHTGSTLDSYVRRDALIPAVACSMIEKSCKVVPRVFHNMHATTLQEEALQQALQSASWLDQHAVLHDPARQFADVENTFKAGLILAAQLSQWESRVLQPRLRQQTAASEAGEHHLCSEALVLHGDTLCVIMAQFYTAYMVLCAQMWFSYVDVVSSGGQLQALPASINPSILANKVVEALGCLSPNPGFWALEQISIILTSLISFYSVISSPDEEPDAEINRLSQVAADHQATQFTDDFRKSFTIGSSERDELTALVNWEECAKFARDWYGYPDSKVYKTAKALWSMQGAQSDMCSFDIRKEVDV